MTNPQDAYTYADLLKELQALTPDQQAQQVRYIGEVGNGKVNSLWVLEEDHIDPSGEGLEPISAYQQGDNPMTEEELAAEQSWPAGLVMLSIP